VYEGHCFPPSNILFQSIVISFCRESALIAKDALYHYNFKFIAASKDDCSNIEVLHVLEGVRVMVCNATFNNISVISWQSVLLVEETRVPGESNQPVASH
jgi:hypothetical protein